MAKKIKWGIIAAGGIAKRRTLPAMQYCDNAVIVAVMDKNPTALKNIQEEYGITAIYEDEDELLKNPEIEAVYVASPVSFHKEQARKVLEAGKHLLLEKPIGLNIKEAEEILSYAKCHSNQKVGIGMVIKHHPAHQEIRKLIKKGLLGDIVGCRAQFFDWFPDIEGDWRQKKSTGGGGVLVDMGIHCIDLLCYLLDDEVEKVYADIATKTFRYEVDDSADCMLRTKKGATLYVDTHYNLPEKSAKGSLEIYGTRGSILATGTIGQEGTGEVLLSLFDEDSDYAGQPKQQQLDYEVKNIYARQITDFSNAIIDNTQPLTTIDNAYKTARIIDALYRSSEEERVIRV